jgi:hypothetical protein
MTVLGFAIEFAQMIRPGQGCHLPKFDLFWQIGRVAFFVMLLGFVLSMIGIIADTRRRYAVASFCLFFPLALLLMLTSECGLG